MTIMKLQLASLVSHLAPVLFVFLSSGSSAPAMSGTPYCVGDGSGLACPCGNSGSPGHGCRNSKFVHGGLLTDTGLASVSADTLVLKGQYISGPAYVASGSSQLGGGNGIVFGDGLLCVGGVQILSKVHTPKPSGVVMFPSAGEVPLSVLGMTTAGSVRHYQILYKDKKLFYCTFRKDNGTNGLSVTWVP